MAKARGEGGGSRAGRPGRPLREGGAPENRGDPARAGDGGESAGAGSFEYGPEPDQGSMDVAHSGAQPAGETIPAWGLDNYESELERTKSQLLVFAREMSAVYQKEREKALKLGRLNDELRGDYLSIVQTLAMVVEAKDQYTRTHLDRCRDYGSALAMAIDPDLLTEEVQYGFLLHDVGKIGVPEAILLKEGPLSAEEARIMQEHPLIGVQLVEPMRRILDSRTVQIIRNHHERFDGKGYPDHLAGDDIPLSARIFSVVDAFDAMTTDRPYRKALSFEESIQRLMDGAGSQFDPAVIEAFVKLMSETDGDSRPGSRAEEAAEPAGDLGGKPSPVGQS